MLWKLPSIISQERIMDAFYKVGVGVEGKQPELGILKENILRLISLL